MGHHNTSRFFPGPGNKADCVRILWRGPVARQRLLWGPMKGLHGKHNTSRFFLGPGNRQSESGYCGVVRLIASGSCGGR